MIDTIKELISNVYDVKAIVRWGGIPMISGIVFAETGLMIGFFLPGDSLLVTAGIIAAAGYLNVKVMLVIVAIAAIVGDQVGYWIGKKTGPAIFKKDDSLLFKKSHVLKAKAFYEKYGGKTIVIARFVPIIRTFAPVIAGVAQMEYRKFVFFNIFGGLLWVFSMILGGYYLGSVIPNIEDKLHYVIAIVVFLSICPGIYEFIRARMHAKKQKSKEHVDIIPY
ncbi:DedA family protein [Candidatus Auribacterota bacterium]